MLTLRSRLRPLAAALLLTLLLLPATARAEVLSNDSLDKALAPVALYPDSLLGNVLVASTYPDQVVAANQWLKAHPGTDQASLASALAGTTWDPSVKALCSLPDVLGMMANDMNWTHTLGQAFVNQTDDVYDSIQRLRARAQATGALKSSGNVVVQTDDSGYVLIGSSNPAVVYVPTYEPAVVYGWSPGRVVATTALVWGTVAILDELFYGSCWDWHGHHVYVGPGYGHCGYYNGRVNVWGGNTFNIDRDINININNIQNNITHNIHNGNTNWHPGTRPGPDQWHGRDGYPPRPPDSRPPTADSSRPQPDGKARPSDHPAFDPSGRQRPPTASSNRPTTEPSTRTRPGGTPSTRPAFDASRLQGQGHGLDVGSGSQTRKASQRGLESRSSRSGSPGQASQPSEKPQAPRSAGFGGRRR